MLRDQRPLSGRAPFAVAGFILAQLLAARLLLSADATSVWFAGMRFGSACAFRAYTGVPCPTCGMTRSVVLALHGQLGEALRVNAAGPFWVAAALCVSIALLYLGWRRAETAKRRVRTLAIAQAGLFAVVLALNWAGALLGFTRAAH